ncbi:hypothetical protein G9C85_07020 [Halorubellus sp. JP-L1]|uniref:hypothetical protein n=1 Tax=Halorubellus sp. JP-L1 TaxID=2715753 RepID=UPI00140E6865|nr:hypothetical protein [Halorubellus sp. JP-L1]NHN41388.1 hypothetical protein [Halorubellus sp. JP-L1]
MNPLSSLKRLLGLDDDVDAEAAADADAAPEADADTDADATRPRELAAELVDAHPDADLDYTPRSLVVLDDLAADVADALDADPEDEATNETVRRMGAYLGETFVRAYDGEWTFDDAAGWVVELSATHQGQPVVLTVPSVLGDVFEGESSFALVHDVFASELDADAPELADADPTEPADDPREEPAPADVVAAFDRLAAELAADHDALDFSPASLSALDDVARRNREDHDGRDSRDGRDGRDGRDTTAFDPDRDEIDLGAHADTVGGHTDAVAGYFASVLRTHHTAEYRGELAETLVVEGATRQATLEPRAIAAAAAADETSFETLYANLREDLGLGSATAE